MTTSGRATDAARFASVAAALFAFLSVAGAASAQATLGQGPAVSTTGSATPNDPRAELRSVENNLSLSEEQRRKLAVDVEAIRNDRARLLAALVETTTRVGEAERKLSDGETRLETLTGSEEAIRQSLKGRREVIGNVLAALQRMGRQPPPAILAAPEDVLRAIRTSMLLGSLLPEMRAETDALVADLSELVKLRQAIAGERETLSEDAAALSLERTRLSALVEARQTSIAATEQALKAEGDRAQDLAQRAATLKDLIAKLESEPGPASRAAEAARKADEAQHAGLETGGAAPHDPARLAPALPFNAMRGQLKLPVTGTLLKGFGTIDGFGGAEKGMSLGTRPGAVVAAPADGWVAYAGPYRTYGRLLILNAGAGYYVVLAGMERLTVDLGQFVLAGEPVAAMGDGSSKTAAAVAIGAAQPILYIEFRKDGVAVDPGPWWTKAELQKVRG